MKLLIRYLLFVIISIAADYSAQAQCVFTAVRSGNFSAPATWASSCTPGAIPSGDATILIVGLHVVLDVPYTVAQGGILKVLNQGSLVGGANLNLGDGTGSQASTWLIVGAGSLVHPAQLTVNKASILIDGPLSPTVPTQLKTDCNLVLINSNTIDNSQTLISGNVDLTSGGANNTMCGTGSVRIAGCVFGGNGAINRLADNCASALTMTVCTQLLATGCPGPLAGTNAAQQACDSFVGVCPRPLPVELTVFTATPGARSGVALHWETASEKNSKSFVVERSATGREFSSLLTVAAAGSSQHASSYDARDEQPLPGLSYYRLRQVDFDGTTTFSPIRLVKVGSASSEGLAVYPGRAPQQWEVQTNLTGEVLAAGPAAVLVLDALGRSQRAVVRPDAAQPGHWQLDLPGLPTGLYIVRLVSAAGTFSQRIIQ